MQPDEWCRFLMAFVVFHLVLRRTSSRHSSREPFASALSPSEKLMTVDADGNLLLLPLTTLQEHVMSHVNASVDAKLAAAKTERTTAIATAKTQAISHADTSVSTLQTSVTGNATAISTLQTHTQGLVQFWQGQDKTGNSLVLPRGDWDTNIGVSYIKVGPGVKVRLYRGRFSGLHKDLTEGEEFNLVSTRNKFNDGRTLLNDRIVSARIRYMNEAF